LFGFLCDFCVIFLLPLPAKISPLRRFLHSDGRAAAVVSIHSDKSADFGRIAMKILIRPPSPPA
jgi:hypothetical protein